MKRSDLPRSTVKNGMVQMPTACGKHVIYYPTRLGMMALHEHKYHIFHTTCECGRAYIVATQDDGAHTRMEGDIAGIIERYEAIPWPEKQMTDENGTFFCKQAPSLTELKRYFVSVAKR